MPTISVIVPVYNVEKYLRCCVDSILAQTFTDIEVLLVDDGSTDGSGAICDEYAQKDSRVRVFHKANGGVSSARNLGLDEATGEWIMFVDSDDKVAPAICERLLEYASEGCMPMCMWCEGNDEGGYRPIISKFEGMRPIEDILKIKIHHPVDKLYERAIIKRENLAFHEKISYAEDAIFNFEYYAFLKAFFIINEPLYYYRILDRSLSHGRFIANYEEATRVYCEKQLALAERLRITDDVFWKEYYSNYFYSFCNILTNNMRKDAPGNWLQKIGRNSAILRSDEFEKVYPCRYECPKDFTKRYIRALELSYHTGSYFWLWLLGVPGKIKRAIKRK